MPEQKQISTVPSRQRVCHYLALPNSPMILLNGLCVCVLGGGCVCMCNTVLSMFYDYVGFKHVT